VRKIAAPECTWLRHFQALVGARGFGRSPDSGSVLPPL
jgi:hypothetical protein